MCVVNYVPVDHLFAVFYVCQCHGCYLSANFDEHFRFEMSTGQIEFANLFACS